MDDLKIDAQDLKYLFSEKLFFVKEAESIETVERPTLEPAMAESVEPPLYPWKGVALLLGPKEVVLDDEAQKTLLAKIVGAIDLNLSKVDLVQPQLLETEVRRGNPCAKLINFGCNLGAEVELQLKGSVHYIKTWTLRELLKDRDNAEKKVLWAQLKPWKEEA